MKLPITSIWTFCHLDRESSKQRGYILQTFWVTSQDISMSRRSAYLSRVSMYLLSFLGIFVNDSVHSLSELSFGHFQHPAHAFGSQAVLWLWEMGNLLSSLFCPGSEAFSFEHSVSFISVVFCSQFNPGHHSYIFKTYTTSGNLVSLPLKRGKIPSNNLGTRHLCCSLVLGNRFQPELCGLISPVPYALVALMITWWFCGVYGSMSTCLFLITWVIAYYFPIIQLRKS